MFILSRKVSHTYKEGVEEEDEAFNIEEDELKRKFPTPRYVEIPSLKQKNSPGVE